MSTEQAGPHQLLLAINLRDEATFDNYLCQSETAPVVDALRHPIPGAEDAGVYLWGAADSGKTHLLQASCHAAPGTALYLPLGELCAADPREVLVGLDALELVCLDDLQTVAGDEPWELALFELFNRIREGGGRLIVAATTSPREIPLQLQDLRSRLGWGMVFHLPRLSDSQLIEILRLRAGRRGMTLSEEVARYIVTRAPRSPSELLALLDRLDSASLQAKRPVSRPFVKDVLGW